MLPRGQFIEAKLARALGTRGLRDDGARAVEFQGGITRVHRAAFLALVLLVRDHVQLAEAFPANRAREIIP